MNPKRKHQARTERSKSQRAALVKQLATNPKPRRPRAHLAYLLAQSINQKETLT